jgi:two-component system, NarL family, sensor kinase
MYNIKILITFLFALHFTTYAQKDSTLLSLKKLSNDYVVKDFDKTIQYSNEGLALAIKKNNKTDQAYFIKQAGLAYYFKGSYDSAANNYYRALTIFETNKIENEDKADLLNQLGKLYRKTKDLDRSLQYYDKALQLYKKNNNLEGVGTILNESGVVFEYKGNYDEAISRYKQSLEIREKQKDDLGKSYSLNFIGGVYTLQKKFTEAENYINQSLLLRQKIKDTFAIALNYSDRGYMFSEKGDLSKAIENYFLSNTIAIKLNYSDLLSTNYKSLSEIFEKKNNTSLSLEYLKKHYLIKDSIYSANKTKQIEELNTKYETVKKEQLLIVKDNKIKQKNIFLVATILGIVLLSLYGYIYYTKKQTQHKILLHKEIIKQQDIATKAVLEAEEKERERIARDLHDGVGQVMSAAKMNLSAFESELSFKDENQKLQFEKVINLVDEGCKEVRNVSHQMMPNALLKAGLSSAIKEFIDKIDSPSLKVNLYTEGLNERLDNNTETVLYRVIQECVNNVIKHSGANLLDISLLKDEDGISATIEDNGKGFDGKATVEGIGLKNIKTRIEFLKGTVDFDSSVGKGTLVAIHIPIDK